MDDGCKKLDKTCVILDALARRIARSGLLPVPYVGPGGGLILAPAHVLGPETPWENIQAFFDAADSTLLPGP